MDIKSDSSWNANPTVTASPLVLDRTDDGILSLDVFAATYSIIGGRASHPCHLSVCLKPCC